MLHEIHYPGPRRKGISTSHSREKDEDRVMAAKVKGHLLASDEPGLCDQEVLSPSRGIRVGQWGNGASFFCA